MTPFKIEGGHRLRGNVRVSGRKNAILGLIAATLLCDGPSQLENVPGIEDVTTYGEILHGLGAQVNWDQQNNRMSVDTGGLSPLPIAMDLAGRIRASYYLLGVLLARHGRADVPLPGGDRIGQRPVDQHFKGLAALGAEVWMDRGIMRARATRLVGTAVYLDVVSVGATIQVMLAATLALGQTTIYNSAREPHVVDIANYLNAAGAKIVGAGTDTVRIQGVKELKGATHTVIPDDIEAGTFMIAAQMTHGDITLHNVIPGHLTALSAKLREVGATVVEGTDTIRVSGSALSKPTQLKTQPYPGFPTDAQSQMTALLATATGTSYVTETLYTDRFRFVQELTRMGAHVRVEGQTAVVEGVPRLTGTTVEATDIRACAALILAGLAADGETTVLGLEHAERGYENLQQKLLALGAKIRHGNVRGAVAG